MINPVIKLNASSDEIKYISTSVGEVETEMGINYHSNLASSYVKYSINPDLSNSTKVDATSKLWSYPSDEEKLGLSERYVHRANLTNLLLDTTYYYQVTAGSTVSPIMQFKTAHGFTMTTFAFVTDTQATPNGYNKVNNLTQMLLNKKKDINFMLITGDIVDRGADESYWENFFGKVEAVKQLPLATIPGNHEYYLTSGGTYYTAEVYNQFFNNPQNGIEERLNSSYYFKYNDILFVMIDTIKDELYEAQRNWFEEVVLKNPSRYIIVGVHAGCYTGGNYVHDATRMQREWLKTFEKYSVDLVLSGHEHMFGYTLPLYNGKESADFGVTHLIGPSGAEKQYNVKPEYEQYFVYSENLRTAGSVIEVMGNKITVTLYNEVGDERHSFTLNAKRPEKPSKKNIDDIVKTIKVNHNKELNEATLNWTAEAYGNIRVIKVTEANGLNLTSVIATPKVLSLNLGSCWEGNNYQYSLELTLDSGEVITKEINLNLAGKPVKPVEPKPSTNNCQTGSFIKIFSYITVSGLLIYLFKRKS